MPTITPHLWYDTQAVEAAKFYTNVFADSKVTNTTTLHNTPSGDAEIVSFQLLGQPFMAISAGPYFKFNPLISFMVNYDPSRDTDAAAHLQEAWDKLIDGGSALMPLQEYPFSKKYGWVQDKYGLSWQLILSDPGGEPRPHIIPSLLFVGEVYGKAKKAGEFYCSIFQPAQYGMAAPYGPGQEPDTAEALMFSDFKLLDTWFAAMDSAREHQFGFNEAISFMINCDNQVEIDYYWEKLSAVPEAEQCGWLKDKYGVSWQVVPTAMEKMMQTSDKAALERVTQAFLKMKKFDLAELERAYRG